VRATTFAEVGIRVQIRPISGEVDGTVDPVDCGTVVRATVVLVLVLVLVVVAVAAAATVVAGRVVVGGVEPAGPQAAKVIEATTRNDAIRPVPAQLRSGPGFDSGPIPRRYGKGPLSSRALRHFSP
jgi:hypothetical protein